MWTITPTNNPVRPLGLEYVGLGLYIPLHRIEYVSCFHTGTTQMLLGWGLLMFSSTLYHHSGNTGAVQ
ncbi:unnamed protein product [Calypogeia fissa]